MYGYLDGYDDGVLDAIIWLKKAGMKEAAILVAKEHAARFKKGGNYLVGACALEIAGATKELEEHVAEGLETRDACVLRHHGYGK